MKRRQIDRLESGHSRPADGFAKHCPIRRRRDNERNISRCARPDPFSHITCRRCGGSVKCYGFWGRAMKTNAHTPDTLHNDVSREMFDRHDVQ
ncbi:hypothetical protein EVAR_96918_1 [Eumeta japonica]|uniref:Uncharacterized protein n=1 Tax=Eumeta variegata TaxID=151549 RepID=A0A4C1WFM0_EUMVA|nr:hypothetical protein EVAR_96918_1 [Eumeta japonica]